MSLSATLEPQNSPTTLGAMIDQLSDVREQRKELAKEVKDLQALEDALEQQIIEALDEQGMRFAGGSTHRAGISEERVPVGEDWDATIEFIKQNDAYYLLERRIRPAIWREFEDAGEPVPGTKPFIKRKLSFRKI